MPDFKLGKISLVLPSAMLRSSRPMQDVLAVNISPQRIKIAHARKGTDGEVIAQHLTQKTFSENADVEISQFLMEACQTFKVNTKSAVCILSSPLFISKNVDMPSTDREEISKIVDLQAGRYTPYSRDEIVIDYICMETAGQYYTNVLLMIVNRQAVDRYFQIFEKAGLTIEKIAIAAEGMALAIDSADETLSENSAFAVIHVAENFSELFIVNHHQMVFVRSIPVGAEQYQKDTAKFQQEFAEEWSKSLMAYKEQGVGRPVKTVFLTGMIKGLEFLEKIMQPKGEPYVIKLVDYTKLFQTDPGAFGNLIPDQVTFFETVAVLGQAPDLKLDLSPKEVKLRRHVREGSREIITFGILIMACLVLACIFLASKILIKQDIMKHLDQMEQSSMDEARLMERASTKTRLVRSLLKNRGKGLYVFDRVGSIISEEIFLTSFGYDNEGNLQLTGTANSRSRVYAFVTDLEESNYFSSVKTKTTTSRRVGQMDVADFEIECTLKEEL